MLQNPPSLHTSSYANIPDSPRILRLKDVMKKMGISRSTYTTGLIQNRHATMEHFQNKNAWEGNPLAGWSQN